MTTNLQETETIEAGSLASVTGFAPGDRILAADGRPISTFGQLRQIRRTEPGKSVAFTANRAGKILHLRATLAQRDEDRSPVGNLGIWTHASVQRMPGMLEGVVLGTRWRRACAADPRGARAVPYRGKIPSSAIRYTRQPTRRPDRIW